MRSHLSARISMRIPMLLIITVFILLKLPHLSYPYYWDESWPYISAVKGMYVHGPSLLPGSLPPDLSRGHPLLFHAAAAAWMHIFGASVVSTHCFALCISLSLLACVYEFSLRLSGQHQALAALLLLATQEMFFVQSSFVLPEVMLALLCLVGLYAYVTCSYALCALALTAAVFTKETGIVLVLVLGADALISLFLPAGSKPQKAARVFCMLAPCIAYAAFLVLQKKTHGWYFYPLHRGYVDYDIDSAWYRFRFSCINNLFSLGFRHVYFLVISCGLLVAIFLRKMYYLSALLLLLLLTWGLITDNLPGHMPSWFWLAVLISCWLAATQLTLRSPFLNGENQRKFFKLSSWFVLCFLLFSAANFFTFRYLVAPLAVLLILVALLLFGIIRSKLLCSAVFFSTLLYTTILTFQARRGHGDTELGAFPAMRVQQAITTYFEQNHLHRRHIASGAYLELVHLTTPSTGFLRYPLPFTNVKWEIDDSTEFIIFDSIEPDGRRKNVENDTAYELAFRFSDGSEWGEVFRKTGTNSPFFLKPL